MKRIRLRRLLLLVAASMAFLSPVGVPQAVAFEGFRCESGRLVLEGDHSYEVRKKCGEPDFADTRQEQRTVRRTVWTRVGGRPFADQQEVTITVTVDEWTYDLGPRRLIRHLIFEQNRLVRVFTGSRGTK
jgi:hypothetical protein